MLHTRLQVRILEVFSWKFRSIFILLSLLHPLKNSGVALSLPLLNSLHNFMIIKWVNFYKSLSVWYKINSTVNTSYYYHCCDDDYDDAWIWQQASKLWYSTSSMELCIEKNNYRSILWWREKETCVCIHIYTHIFFHSLIYILTFFINDLNINKKHRDVIFLDWWVLL